MNLSTRGRAAVAAVTLTAAAGAAVLFGGGAHAAPGLPNYPADLYCYSSKDPRFNGERVHLTSPRRLGSSSVVYRIAFEAWTGRYYEKRRASSVPIAYLSSHRWANWVCAAATYGRYRYDSVVSW